MPHDKNGNKLQVGDEVVLRGKITHLSEIEEYRNVTIETAPMFPNKEPGVFSAVNTRQLELVHSGPVSHSTPVTQADVEPPPDGPGSGPS